MAIQEVEGKQSHLYAQSAKLTKLVDSCHGYAADIEAMLDRLIGQGLPSTDKTGAVAQRPLEFGGAFGEIEEAVHYVENLVERLASISARASRAA